MMQDGAPFGRAKIGNANRKIMFTGEKVDVKFVRSIV
jgi:hypothetical protein